MEGAPPIEERWRGRGGLRRRHAAGRPRQLQVPGDRAATAVAGAVPSHLLHHTHIAPHVRGDAADLRPNICVLVFAARTFKRHKARVGHSTAVVRALESSLLATAGGKSAVRSTASSLHTSPLRLLPPWQKHAPSKIRVAGSAPVERACAGGFRCRAVARTLWAVGRGQWRVRRRRDRACAQSSLNSFFPVAVGTSPIHTFSRFFCAGNTFHSPLRAVLPARSCWIQGHTIQLLLL